MCGPQTLVNKLDTLYDDKKIKNIKHISFGAGDTWAITMKNGWCYCNCYQNPAAINKYNGDIKYVSMNCSKNKWIV